MKAFPLYEVRKIRDLKDMLKQSSVLYKDRNAFLIKEKKGEPYKSVSFGKYSEDVDAFGTALLQTLGSGSRIAILAETRYEWYVSYLSVVNGTGIVVPLDKEQPSAEIASLLNRAKADCVIYSSSKKDVMDAIENDIPGVRIKICMDDVEQTDALFTFSELLKRGYDLLEGGNRDFLDAILDPEAMTILLFTSGTTDKSKAVMLCQKNICENLMGMCSMTYIEPEDVFLSVLPLHHTYECTCGFLCPVYRGAAVAQCEGLRYITKNMQESKVSVILVVPLMLEMFHRAIMKKAKADPKAEKKFNFGMGLSRFLLRLRIDKRKKLFKAVHDNFGGHLRLLVCGGASVNPQILADMRDLGIPSIQGYGLTECAPILALNRDVNYNDASAGLSLPNCEIRIIDKDEDGIGEIIGKGPNVMMGYYENESATKESIDGEGFYHTGDLGYMDGKGFVIITGRKKNVIVAKNGKNIFPEEIEALISESDLISEVIVYAGGEDDGDLVITAEVRPDTEALEKILGEKPVKEDIQSLMEKEVKKVNARLISYKAIRKVIYREEDFEKTTSKKIKRQYK